VIKHSSLFFRNINSKLMSCYLIVTYKEESFFAGNTKGGSMTVQLTSCLICLDLSVLQIKTKIVSCHTAHSKPVKQDVSDTSPFSVPCFMFQTVFLRVCACVYVSSLSVCMYVCMYVCFTFLHSVSLHVCYSFFPSVCLSVRLSICIFVCLNVSLLVRLSVCEFICLSFLLLICPSIHLSVYQYIHLSVLSSILPFVCLSVHPSIHLSVCLSICLPFHLSVRLSVYPPECLNLHSMGYAQAKLCPIEQILFK
jgi:hypothetical protein